MRLRMAAVLALLLTSCGADPAPPTPPVDPLQPPRWTGSPAIPALMSGVDQQAAGWDGGLVLARGTGGGPDGRDPEVYTSADGRDWRAAVPESGMRASSCCGRVVAGHGAAAYLLGWNSREELVVWRTEDGERWTAAPLDLRDLGLKRSVDLEATITAGPDGVLVAAKDAYAPPSFDGVYVWHSPEGRSFGAMARLPGQRDGQPLNFVVEAIGAGFLLGMSAGEGSTALFSSRDGTDWREAGAGPPGVGGIQHLSANGATVVAFPYPLSPSEPQVWHRRDGEWRPATLDPGRLPDAGVVPADQRRVQLVRAWGAGFIAVGNTFGEEGQERAGMVWHSADGASWSRMPVREHGFDAAWPLMDVAVSRQTATLFGYRSDPAEHLLTWQAQVP
ncbi:hypothetical protein [Phytohabitans kaempferiae]|uniref:Exo-alpha-sialidase n=1 Tax=Phytohabitans kaempferiae TaxID=1620943 RepID=A0ABV6LX73_9ACTN